MLGTSCTPLAPQQRRARSHLPAKTSTVLAPAGTVWTCSLFGWLTSRRGMHPMQSARSGAASRAPRVSCLLRLPGWAQPRRPARVGAPPGLRRASIGNVIRMATSASGPTSSQPVVPVAGTRVQGAPRRCAIGVLPTLDPVSAHRARSYEQDRIGAVTPCQTLVAAWTAAQQVLTSEPGHEPQQQQAATTPGDPSDRF